MEPTLLFLSSWNNFTSVKGPFLEETEQKDLIRPWIYDEEMYKVP